METHRRTLAKTLAWRLVATAITAIIAGLATGSVAAGLVIGGVDTVLKLAGYYLAERLWARSSWGLTRPKGFVVWLTGLPCSGKTTIARELAAKLYSPKRPVAILDGDVLRSTSGPKVGLCSDLGFSKEDRVENLRRVREVAYLMERAGTVVIVAAITPFERDRELARVRLSRCLTVWVDTPDWLCAERDVKGMWAKAKSGEISGFTGFDAPYEPPRNALVVSTVEDTVPESAALILDELKRRRW